MRSYGRINPLSLGVETLGGVFTKLIERNTTIPTKKSEIFSTAADMQTAVTVHVLQGERSMAQDNVSLGNFTLTGIPPSPRGVPQIEVTFDIDANGILNVSAKDLATGKQTGITITASTKLSEKEKERMIKEAEQFAEADKKKKEEAEIRNQADTLIYTVEKTKTDLKDKIPQDLVTRLDDATKKLKDTLAGKDADAIKKEIEAMNALLKEVGTTAYQQAAAAAASTASTGGSNTSSSSSAGSQGYSSNQDSGQKVVDAEYKVESGNK
jgi:molecular chaperone DnaK